MINLFVDSSRKNLSVVIIKDNKIIFNSNVISESKHSNFLVNEIKKGLLENSLKIDDINNIIVLNGPGSFTGIRIGLTVCKTLSWALNKNIYVLNNLKAISIGIKDDVVISVIPDKKDNSYVGIYSNFIIEDYMSVFDDRLLFNNKNITVVYLEDSMFINNLKEKLINNNIKFKKLDTYDYISLCNYITKKEPINPHFIDAFYLKKIDAEKNLQILKLSDNDISSINYLGLSLHQNYKYKPNSFTKCFVAKKDDKVIGFVTYDLIYERCEITDIIVDEKHRNKKIASNMINNVIIDCLNNNCNSITLEVNENNKNAIRLYKKYDFKVVSTKKSYYNKKDDAYVMQKDLEV